MEIKEAYKVLELKIDSSQEEIEKKFKDLVKSNHPDKGGDLDKMQKINEARDLAVEYSQNRSLIKIVHEITRSESNILVRSNQIDKEVGSIYRRAQRRVGNRLRSMKDLTGLLGLVAGIGTLIVSKVIPIIDFPKSSFTPTVLLLATVVLSIYYLLFNNRIKKLENNVEDFKESLDDKELFHDLLLEIIGDQAGEYVSKDELNKIIDHWAGGHSNQNGSTALLLLSTSASPQRIYRLIGSKDFMKMILLKGEQFDFIAKNENNNKGRFKVHYKVLEKPMHNKP